MLQISRQCYPTDGFGIGSYLWTSWFSVYHFGNLVSVASDVRHDIVYVLMVGVTYMNASFWNVLGPFPLTSFPFVTCVILQTTLSDRWFQGGNRQLSSGYVKFGLASAALMSEADEAKDSCLTTRGSSEADEAGDIEIPSVDVQHCLRHEGR